MKRASFFFVLICLALFSFGQAYGQNGAITLSSVTGTSVGHPDRIECGQPVTFFIKLENPAGDAVQYGIANGFRIYSPDGATWTPGLTVDTQYIVFPTPNTLYDTTWYGEWRDDGLPPPLVWQSSTPPAVLDGGIFVNTYTNDGIGADTVGFAGFQQNNAVGLGIFSGLVADPAWAIRIASTDCADTGLTICLDSSYFPPSGNWLWADGISYKPSWDGPHCYTLYKTPDLPPDIDCTNGTVNFNHCVVSTTHMTASDVEGDYPLTWTTNVGMLQNSNGNGTGIDLVFTAPGGSKAGCTTAVVTATDTFGNVDSCSFDLCWTNNAPTLTGCGDTTKVGRGNSATNDVNGADQDGCDVAGLVYSINSVSPVPVGTYSIDANGTVTFNTDVTDAPSDQVFDFNVCVSDGDQTTCCDVYFDVLAVEPFTLQIEKTHGSYQGQHETVDVTLETGSLEIGGFDILIAYDASALNFQKAIPGDHFYGVGGCGWEYFTYRFSAFGNCGSICPSGKLRVTGIAETNNGPAHPNCYDYSAGEVLFSLDFLVTDDRTLECSYVPIRFCWFDCGDNTLSSVTGDSLFISRFVYEYDLGGEITNNNDPWAYPTYAGAQDDDCFVNPNKHPYRFIDFINGGVDIACAESLDARGDINLNEIPNEIADAVLFSRYFVYGLGVFTINMQGQIAATDVNADGLALSVADLVYQIRIIVGDANPFPKLNPVEVNYTVNNGTIAVDQEVGAAFVEVAGMSDVVALSSDMETQFAYDAESNTTRILVYSMEKGHTINGEFLRVKGDVLNIEMATYDGAPVVANKLPTDFALNQNYPNPFNPTTTISFNLPTRSDVTLAIYNVTGQRVADFSGTYDAGVQSVEWDASQFASGIYFYKLTTDNFSSTKRMVLVK